MECFMPVRRTRLVFQVISFGAILLWIMFGSYTRLEHPPHLKSAKEGQLMMMEEKTTAGMRHMLSLSPEIMVDANNQGDKCDMLYENGTRVNIENNECSTIHSLSSNFSSCNFLHCVESCNSDDGLIDYLSFIYCTLSPKLTPLAMIILFFWLIFLFIFLGATAEEYFCPALTVISSILRLSQNVAGVTLLALGNGAPDIFSAFAAVNQDEDKKASLAVGALFGAGIFVTTIVVGAVAVTKPFVLTQRPFLRDIIFYIFAAFWTFSLLWTHSMTIYNAVGFVSLYIFYVVVVIVGRVIFQRWKKWKKMDKFGTGDMPRAPTPPDGREMNDSSNIEPAPLGGGLATLGALLPGVGITGTYSQTPAIANGNVNMRKDEKEEEERNKHEQVEEEEEEEVDTSEVMEDPRVMFRITDVGSSDTSGGHVDKPPIIRIQDEDDDGQVSSVILSKKNMEERRRQKELAGASLPPLLPQDKLLGSSALSQRIRGASAGPSQGKGGYGSIQDNSGHSRSPSPTRKALRKTISGALDVTEGVGAVFGIPHVPELWEEVSRTHTRSRTSSRVSRGRSHSRSALIEEGGSDNDRTPLLGPSVSTNISGREDDSSSEDDDQEGEGDIAPVIRLTTRRRRHPFIKMLQGIWPFGKSFRELGLFGKFYEIIKSPAGLLLCLTVPVIDTNEDDHHWNKWLNVLHCVTAPVLISLITKQGLILIGGVFPVWTLMLILGTLVAILVACTSRNEKPPIYHCVFAWVGFAVAVVWIYSIANEIVNLLQAFGIVIKLSDGILGLTLLAWGNSIGDAVSNVTMAKQGFPRMAIGACFGGPLLNMLLGIGIASVVKTIRKRDAGLRFRLYFTQVELVAAVFLISSLVCTLVVVSSLKFRLRRPYGIFLVAIYVIFLTVAILAEVQVFKIHIKGVIDE